MLCGRPTVLYKLESQLSGLELVHPAGAGTLRQVLRAWQHPWGRRSERGKRIEANASMSFRALKAVVRHLSRSTFQNKTMSMARMLRHASHLISAPVTT